MKKVSPELLHKEQHKESGGSSLCPIFLQDLGPGWENRASATKAPGGKGFFMPKV